MGPLEFNSKLGVAFDTEWRTRMVLCLSRFGIFEPPSAYLNLPWRISAVISDLAVRAVYSVRGLAWLVNIFVS
jgi:hypothetical protein